jgi:hypothetical protein
VAKRHYGSLLRLGALPLASALACDLLLRAAGAGLNAELLSLPLVLALMGIAEARMIVATWALLHGRPIEPAAVLGHVRQHWPAVILAYTFKWLLILLGFLFLLLPGVLALLVLFAVPTVTVIERRGVWGSLQRSRALARGQKRRLLATLGLFDITAAIFAIGLTALYSDPATGDLPLWADVINWSVSLLLIPIRATLMAVVYADLRVRSEGYDLEAAVGDLAGAA